MAPKKWKKHFFRAKNMSVNRSGPDICFLSVVCSTPKDLISWIVSCASARNFTVVYKLFGQSNLHSTLESTPDQLGRKIMFSYIKIILLSYCPNIYTVPQRGWRLFITLSNYFISPFNFQKQPIFYWCFLSAYGKNAHVCWIDFWQEKRIKSE